MENKICTWCFIEKHINIFDKRYSQCKKCIIERGVERYYDNKDKISIQQKTYYVKNRQKLLQKGHDYRNRRNTDFKGLVRSDIELENRLKAMEEGSNYSYVLVVIDIFANFV